MKTTTTLMAVGVIFAVGACSNSDDSPEEGLSIEEVAARYNYDVDSAELTPVYELAPAFDPSEYEYASHVFYADCLKDVVDYDIPEAGARSELFTQDNQLMFNEEIASTWGYPGLRLPRQEAPGISDADLTPDVQSEFDRCGDEMSKKMDSPSPVAMNDFYGAGWDATEGNSDIKNAEDKWYECMAPVGVVDLPETPGGMPPESFWGEPNEDGHYADQPVELTEKERDIAMADAQCRTEAGYDEAVFRARAEGELA